MARGRVLRAATSFSIQTVRCFTQTGHRRGGAEAQDHRAPTKDSVEGCEAEMSETEEEDEIDEIVLAVCRVTKAREKGGEISAEDHAIVQYAESMACDVKPYARRRPCLACGRPVADALVLP